MIYFPDTNVFEERLRQSPEPGVLDFFHRAPAEQIRLSAVVLAEIAQGVENNPIPPLQNFLAETLLLLVADFGEREALEWGRLTSAGFRQGLTMEVRDTLIAAAANAVGGTVVTRNVRHFSPLGVRVFNPWQERLA